MHKYSLIDFPYILLGEVNVFLIQILFLACNPHRFFGRNIWLSET